MKKFQGVNIEILDDGKNKIGSVEIKFSDHKPLKENYDFNTLKQEAEKLFRETIKIMSE